MRFYQIEATIPEAELGVVAASLARAHCMDLRATMVEMAELPTRGKKERPVEQQKLGGAILEYAKRGEFKYNDPSLEAALAKLNLSREGISGALSKLVKAGKLERKGRGVYRLSGLNAKQLLPSLTQ